MRKKYLLAVIQLYMIKIWGFLTKKFCALQKFLSQRNNNPLVCTLYLEQGILNRKALILFHSRLKNKRCLKNNCIVKMGCRLKESV